MHVNKKDPTYIYFFPSKGSYLKRGNDKQNEYCRIRNDHTKILVFSKTRLIKLSLWY